MGDEGNGQRTRRSGTGFPAMPLPEAAAAIKKAGAYGYQHPTEALAGYMNHSTTNSGAFRAKAAALRDYGLISGRGDVITLTELAQTIAHPDSAEAERRALRDAFFHAELFARLHDTVAKGVELDTEHLGNAAVRSLGVSATSKAAFIESFVAGAVAAGVAERIDERSICLLGREVPPPSTDEEGDETAATVASPVATPVTAVRVDPQPAAALPTVHQTWRVVGGSVTFEITYDFPLPASAFAQVAKVVEECERLAQLLESRTRTRDTSSASDPPASPEPDELTTGE